MKRLGFGVVVCASIIVSNGCDRRSSSSATTAPATAPATTPPAAAPRAAATRNTAGQIQARVADAAPPASQPAILSGAVMSINQQPVEFPPAKLRVSMADGKVIGLLFSDDPKDAISDQYMGHSFYFEMELDAAESKDFMTSVWRYTADSNDRRDTPYGIFLDGHRRQLQPLDVTVRFEPSGLGSGVTNIWLSGRFLELNIQDPGQPPREDTVRAQFPAKTLVK